MLLTPYIVAHVRTLNSSSGTPLIKKYPLLFSRMFALSLNERFTEVWAKTCRSQIVNQKHIAVWQYSVMSKMQNGSRVCSMFKLCSVSNQLVIIFLSHKFFSHNFTFLKIRIWTPLNIHLTPLLLPYLVGFTTQMVSKGWSLFAPFPHIY